MHRVALLFIAYHCDFHCATPAFQLCTAVAGAQLIQAALALSKAALAAVDLTHHDASHPRLGVVDHVSCQPVGRAATIAVAATIASAIGDASPPWPRGTSKREN